MKTEGLAAKLLLIECDYMQLINTQAHVYFTAIISSEWNGDMKKRFILTERQWPDLR